MSLAVSIQCAYVGPEVCSRKAHGPPRSQLTRAPDAPSGGRLLERPEAQGKTQPPAARLRQQLVGGGPSERLSRRLVSGSAPSQGSACVSAVWNVRKVPREMTEASRRQTDTAHLVPSRTN